LLLPPSIALDTVIALPVGYLPFPGSVIITDCTVPSAFIITCNTNPDPAGALITVQPEVTPTFPLYCPALYPPLGEKERDGAVPG